MYEEDNKIPKRSNIHKKDLEIDDTFVEPKKRGLLVGIILFLLISSVIGLVVYYFLIIDSPKKIFLTSVNNLLSNNNITTNEEYPLVNADIKLDINMMSDKEEYKQIKSVVNDIEINTKLRGESNTKEDYGNIVVSYKKEELLNFSFLTQRDSNKIYGKLNNLLDKVLLLELTEEELKEIEKDKVNEDDLKQVVSSIKEATKTTLDTATYKKEYVKLNNQYVKKITLVIDKAFVETLLTKLLQDTKFLESYSRLNNKTIEEIQDEINFLIDDLEDTDEANISIYLSILNNKFLKLEILDGEEYNLIINKEDSKYSFEYLESYTLKYKGYIKLVNSSLTINFEDISNSLITEIYLDINKDNVDDITKLDTKDAIKLEDITEKDTDAITNNMFENKALGYLLIDLGIMENNTPIA